jgi:cytochrome P450
VGKGEQALVLLGAANRDPAQHERPDRLDLSRTPSRSLAFGLGPHFCVGAGLARLEAQLTFLLLPKLGWTEQQVAWTAPRDPTARVFRRLSELHVAAHSFA